MMSRLALQTCKGVIHIRKGVIQTLRSTSTRFLKTTPILKKKEYTDTEEWHYTTKDYIKIGLTSNAVEQLGELVFIEFQNEPGDLLEKGDEPVSIESVKAVNGIIIPFDCKLVDNNEIHLDNLEHLNENPECEENSWIIKVKKQE
jgi:glycine cleavage system H protein